MLNNEKIMVCVHSSPSGDELIDRGIRLSKLLHCPLYILTILPCELAKLDSSQSESLNSWKQQSEEAGAHFIVKHTEKRKPAEVIKETAHSYNVTQLIVGQSGQSRWQEIIHGCFVNDLLENIGEIDLHLVAMQKV